MLDRNSRKPIPRLSVAVADYHRGFAARYVEIAKSTAIRVSAIAIVWTVAVLATWYGIQDKVREKRVELAPSARQAKSASDSLECLLKLRAHESLPHCKPSEAGVTTGRIQQAREAEHLANETLRSSAVKFTLPTFTSVDVPTRYAPMVLSVVVLLFAAYLVAMRNRVFTYLARSVRISKQNVKLPIEQIGDVLSPRSWWLPPLPSRDGQAVTSSDFAQCLGWRSAKEATGLSIGFLWLLLVCVQLHLTYLALTYAAADPAASAFALSAVYVAIALTTLVIASGWFLRRSVPDEVTIQDQVRRDRRDFLMHVSLGAALVTLTCAAYRSANTNTGRTYLKPAKHALARWSRWSPRFRLRKRHARLRVTLSTGFYVNRASRVVHRVQNSELLAVRSDRMLTNRLVAFTAMRKLSSFVRPLDRALSRRRGYLVHEIERHRGWVRSAPTLEFSTSSFSAETGAIELFRRNRADEAFALLMAGIAADYEYKRGGPQRRKRFSIRLYDLFAREAARRGRGDQMALLLRQVSSSHLAEVLANRVAKWSDRSGNWWAKMRRQGRSSNVGSPRER
jgi:hypothetical protein